MEDLEDLYENAPCGYLSLAADGVIIKANSTLSGWLGTPTSDLLGKRFYDLLNVAGKIFHETHFAPLLRMQGYLNEVALDLVGANGIRLPVLANAVERRNSAGTVQFTRITLFQAAERRRYERELVEAKNTADRARMELEELNRSLEERIAVGVAERLHLEEGLVAEQEIARLREQFVAILGHDLRNPLASIAGGLNILFREPQTDRARRVLAMMSQSTERMFGLIQDMLDLARSRAGQGMSIELKPTDLQAVIDQVVEESRVAFPDRDIETSVNLPNRVVCDRGRMAQLVSNLLGNALTHGAPDRPIQISAVAGSTETTISVSNEGKEIPEHVRDHLFKPFFRASTSKEKQGLGLGLFICREIARSHGASLHLESGPGRTRFVFRVPVVAPDRSDVEIAEPQQSRSDD